MSDNQPERWRKAISWQHVLLVTKLCACLCIVTTAVSVCLSVYYFVPASLHLGASTAAQSAGMAFGYEAASRVMGFLQNSKGSLSEVQMESVSQYTWAFANGLSACSSLPILPSVKQLTSLTGSLMNAVLW